ncbi:MULTISPECIES: VMAP-C domain-containing protein [unclassified Streptomyces]|uniref:VMAP-C domain-containing protein n=1 Tax=unclassified Streptomyces TaxID=2593676 RepID=UPI0022B6594A|nr:MULTISPECIES: trypsin-like peptidase domain-containing protein [unclassified Streptomyces]MCZ7413685.1 trypsin-like peptidase domain-containing protein [Streptomyces sp. WMMC897]MCZ7430681.1 trypsin-like peptidase domain-containing protein [Streptomyces sp. WMMC1477]
MLSHASGELAGSGLHLGGRHVLTCAHVVNEALGREMFEQSTPDGSPLRVEFPCLPQRPGFTASLLRWRAAHRVGAPGDPAAPGDLVWAGDLALLELAEDPGLQPPPWRPMTPGQRVRAWYGDGAAYSYADSLVGSLQDDHAFVDGELRGAAIGHGYSGGPLWCETEGAVVGLVLGMMSPPPGSFRGENVLRRAIVAPWQAIEPFAADGADATPPRADPTLLPPRPVAPSVRLRLRTCVQALLPSPEERAHHIAYVLDELGLPPAATDRPTVADVVELVLTRHRAAAVLSDVLTPESRAETLRLLALCRGALVPGILTPLELASLLEHLDGEPEGLLEEAARDALGNTTFWDERTPAAPGATAAESVEHLVVALENYWGDSGSTDTTHRVPALLTAVEHVAALCPANRMEELRQWAESVAQRLGVHESVLLSRRADAEDWARARRFRLGPSEPRLTVLLDRAPQGGHRCTLWFDPGTAGNAGLRQVVAEDEPRTPRDIARLVQDVLLRELSPAAGRGRPLIEFQLEPEDLDLPVDRWDDGDPDGGVPAVLGVEYRAVVSCPELRTATLKRRRAWEARSLDFPQGGFARVTAEHSEAADVYTLLHRDQRIGRITVGCAAEHRVRLQTVCLTQGIPVVLWDRNDSPRRTDVLTGLMLNGSPRNLPERIRVHRADTLGRPPEDAVAPVLVWDDASRTPPEPYWSDPSWEEPVS